MRLAAVILLLACAVALCQISGPMMPGPGVKGYAAGGNNVTLVSGHKGGTQANAAASVAYDMGGVTVTSGNSLLCGVTMYGLGWPYANPISGMLTQTAGTATSGTITIDQYSGGLDTPTGVFTGLYRVPITGSGTITVTFSPGDSGLYFVIGCAEFSGLHASPLTATLGTVTGTGTAHSTGSISSSDIGVMLYVASENPNADFTRTYSDTLIFNVGTGGSTGTGIIQYKIINSSPNTMTDTTGTDSEDWKLIYVLYKSS